MYEGSASLCCGFLTKVEQGGNATFKIDGDQVEAYSRRDKKNDQFYSHAYVNWELPHAIWERRVLSVEPLQIWQIKWDSTHH